MTVKDYLDLDAILCIIYRERFTKQLPLKKPEYFNKSLRSKTYKIEGKTQ